MYTSQREEERLRKGRVFSDVDPGVFLAATVAANLFIAALVALALIETGCFVGWID